MAFLESVKEPLGKAIRPMFGPFMVLDDDDAMTMRANTFASISRMSDAAQTLGSAAKRLREQEEQGIGEALADTVEDLAKIVG